MAIRWRNLVFVAAGAAVLMAQQIDTPKIPVRDTYHGKTVTDDYRWLEDGQDAKVLAWSRAQNQAARAYLDRLPGREALRRELTAILTRTSVAYGAIERRPGRWFAIKRDPALQQPLLVKLKSLDEPLGEATVLDPNKMDAKSLVSIDWFRPSPDGKLVAISLSTAGSESGDVHVIDADTGQLVERPVERVNGGTAGGDVAWAPGGQGFYYTRYPHTGERPESDLAFYQQVYYHQLGTEPSKDRYELGKDAPKIAEFRLECDAQGRVLASMQNGDSGEFVHFLRGANGQWQQISRYADRLIEVRLGPQGSLYAISRQGTGRGKIVSLPGPKVLAEETEGALISNFWGSPSLVVTGTRIYALTQLGGPQAVRAFDLKGRRVSGPEVGAVESADGLSLSAAGEILFLAQSFLRPPRWLRFQPSTDKTVETSLAVKPAVDLSDCEVVREYAVSRDGTKVPVSILFRKGLQRNGKNPALATGYGGFGLSTTPAFMPTLRPLLDRGFVLAFANLRGGGEYGEEWHEQGRLTRKQKVFDDFAAVLGHMTTRGYSSPDRLAIRGGSNGGLLMGALLTQHPESCRAVVSAVGIYDMLRSELSPNGAFNVVEYGTVKEPEHFKALFAYSPYHRVREGVKYPSVLFMTGQNDPRVDPMHSRKMTARLQSVGCSALLRTDDEAGHGGGTPLRARIEELTDMYAFILASVAAVQ